jgi:hypothetical protein
LKPCHFWRGFDHLKFPKRAKLDLELAFSPTGKICSFMEIPGSRDEKQQHTF